MPIRTVQVGSDAVTAFGAPVTVKITSLNGKPLAGVTVEMNLQSAIKRGKTDSYGVCTIQLPKNQDVEIWVGKSGVNLGSGTGLMAMVGKIYGFQRSTGTAMTVYAHEYPAGAGYGAAAVGIQGFDLFGWAAGALQAVSNVAKPAAQAISFVTNPVGSVMSNIIAPQVSNVVKAVTTPAPSTRLSEQKVVTVSPKVSAGQSTTVRTAAPSTTTRASSPGVLEQMLKWVPSVGLTELIAPSAPSTVLTGDLPSPKSPPTGTTKITDVLNQGGTSGAQNPVIQNPAQYQSGLVDLTAGAASPTTAAQKAQSILDKYLKGISIPQADIEWARLNEPQLIKMIESGTAKPATTPVPAVKPIEFGTLIAGPGNVIWNVAAAGYDPVLSKKASGRGNYTSLYDAWAHSSVRVGDGSLNDFRKAFLEGKVDVDIVTTKSEITWELANGITEVKASRYADTGGRSIIGDPTGFTVYQEKAGTVAGPVKGIGFSWSGLKDQRVIITTEGSKTTGAQGVINQLMTSNDPAIQALRNRTVGVKSLSATDAGKQAVFQQMAANLIQRGSTVLDVPEQAEPLTQEDLDKMKGGGNKQVTVQTP